MPLAASLFGSTLIRTAYFCEPNTFTWATPSTIDRRCASWVSPYSFTVDSGKVSELRVRYRIALSAGFTLRKVGGVGMVVGSCRCAAEIAACTSCAAASMLRSRPKVSVIEVEPKALVEVIVEMPAMVENSFSSGVATAVAIVSGEAPGSLALTEMVGKSTFGNSFTGSLG